MQHGRTCQSLLLQCISLFLLLVYVKDYSNSAVSTVQFYHNIIQTFSVLKILYAKIGKFQLYFSGNVQFMWPLKSKCWTSFTGIQHKFRYISVFIWKHSCHFNQWLLKTYVSQVLSWRHWPKFCVSRGSRVPDRNPISSLYCCCAIE